MEKIELYNDDCLNIFNSLDEKSIDLILCDLPYGMTSCDWDNIIPFDRMWKGIERVKKNLCPVILFSSQPFTTKCVASTLSLL